MTQIDEELRDLLRRKADEVPMHGRVPSALVGRARRRIALNSVGLGLAVVALAGGAFASVRAIQQHQGKPGSFSSSPPNPAVTNPAVTTSACTAGQLRAVGSMDGAAGSRGGAVRLTNYSNTTCTLRGTPAITLYANGRAITSGVKFISSPPAWKANALAQPAGWPTVTLAPFKSASFRVLWSNWCPQGRAAPLWYIHIGSGTVAGNGLEAVSPPPCNGPGMPSTIAVGPFEPSK